MLRRNKHKITQIHLSAESSLAKTSCQSFQIVKKSPAAGSADGSGNAVSISKLDLYTKFSGSATPLNKLGLYSSGARPTQIRSLAPAKLYINFVCPCIHHLTEMLVNDANLPMPE